MVGNGFDLAQIREDTWRFTLKEYGHFMRLDAVIWLAMDIYCKIILKSKSPD